MGILKNTCHQNLSKIEKYNHTASSVTQFRDKNLYHSHFPAYWHLLFLPFIVHSSSHHLTAMKVSKRLVYIGLLLNKKVWFLPMISNNFVPLISHFFDCTLDVMFWQNWTFSFFQNAIPQGTSKSIINQWWKNLRNHGKNAKQKCQWNLSIRNNLWSNHE